MSQPVIIDVDVEQSSPDPTLTRPKATRKRKNVTIMLQNLKTSEEKRAFLEALEKELEGLFAYYREVMNRKVEIEIGECVSRNAVVAALMEESELPLSKLVEEIHDRLNNKVGNGEEPVTHASVKSSVLLLGQRMTYGLPNPHADVLEDHSGSCFWCWETRDVKFIPKSVRGQLVVRRTCRRRIHERITAVSELISSLKKPESEPNYNEGLVKALSKLGKTCTEADIRLLVDGLLQKNSEDMAKTKASKEEKLLIKQLEKKRREVEKEKESMQSGLKREKLLSGSDLKLLQGEERNDVNSCEKRKQQKKHADEQEKDQRRREKEEAELKKKRSLQKQASIMERFLKRSKTAPTPQNDKVSTKSIASDSLSSKSESVSDSATVSMDCILASSSDIMVENIRKSHLTMWHHLGQAIRSNRNQGWGLRQKPRTEISTELKLTVSKAVAHYDELGMEKQVDGLGESSSDIRSCLMDVDSSLPDAKKYCRRKQLFQFDNAHRPAFYGIWCSKSHVVGPRHPLRKDPSLDYDVSSDEEWEEEEPGESLSDCDKDEEESPEEGSKSDGESEEDGFFVPDGYLSEDEGAQVDRMETDIFDTEGADSSPSCKDDLESEEFCTLLRQQKYLNNLTEHALRKNQPLVIPNLVHDKLLLLGHNLSGTPKMEQMCLQALSMYALPGSSSIEISLNKMQDEGQEACISADKGGSTPVSVVAAITDSDLPMIVTTIQSCSQGMNKVLESLRQKFPSISKSLLRNKVREVSDYADNRLQVKKEVLMKLGLPVKPEKSSRRPRSITAFFSKRCLPPAGESVKLGETSPLPSMKSYSADHERPESSHNV